MAIPSKSIDAEQVQVGSGGARHAEIAEFFGCDRSTVECRFAAETAKGKAALKFTLRRLQLRAAERGSAAMLIFLGKTVLGQVQRDAEDPITL